MIAKTFEERGNLRAERAPLSSADSFFRRVWVFPAVFFAHIAEEAPRFGGWAREVLGASDMPLSRFLWNNAVFMVALLTLTAYAAMRQTRASATVLLFWVSGQQFWNFAFHLYTQVLFDTYSPGIVTATLLYYPVSLTMAYHAVRAKLVSPVWLAAIVVTGALGMAFTIWSGLYHFGPVPGAWLPAQLRA